MGATFGLLIVVVLLVVAVVLLVGLVLWLTLRRRPEPRGFDVEPVARDVDE